MDTKRDGDKKETSRKSGSVYKSKKSDIDISEMLKNAINENDYSEVKKLLEQSNIVTHSHFRAAVNHYMTIGNKYDYRIVEALSNFIKTDELNEMYGSDKEVGISIFHGVASDRSYRPEIIELLLRKGAKYNIKAECKDWGDADFDAMHGKTVEEMFSTKRIFKKESFAQILERIKDTPDEKTQWDNKPIQNEPNEVYLANTFVNTLKRKDSNYGEQIIISFSQMGYDKRTKTIHDYYKFLSERSCQHANLKYTVADVESGCTFKITMLDNEYNRENFAKHTETLFKKMYVEYQKAGEEALIEFHRTNQSWKKELEKVGIHIFTYEERQKTKKLQTSEISLLLAAKNILGNNDGYVISLIPEILKLARDPDELKEEINDHQTLHNISRNPYILQFFPLKNDEKFTQQPIVFQEWFTEETTKIRKQIQIDNNKVEPSNFWDKLSKEKRDSYIQKYEESGNLEIERLLNPKKGS